jgi:hypothetical protein
MAEKYAHKRARREARRAKFDRLKFLGEMLCESHTPMQQRKIMREMMKIILPLLKGSSDVKELVELFAGCSYEGEPTFVKDGRMLYMQGTFSLDELSKGLVWGKATETVQ